MVNGGMDFFSRPFCSLVCLLSIRGGSRLFVKGGFELVCMFIL